MALLKVNPTRMVLLNLKKRVKSAKRGHKLLKDKQDGLMKKFMEIIRDAKDLRLVIEKELQAVFSNLINASAFMPAEELETALKESKTSLDLKVTTKNVMSVHIPVFDFNLEGSALAYGFAQTSGDLDQALYSLTKVLPDLLKLAQIEKSAESLAIELETTRRRVNALEHKLIPDLKETVKFIQMKLGENERSSIVNKMYMKAKMEAEEEKKRREASLKY